MPKAIPFLVAVVAIDLTLVFGFEAFRILASPMMGMERLVFAQSVAAAAKAGGLSVASHALIAATFGVLNLGIAVTLFLHLATRIGALRGGRICHDLLDAALIFIIAVTLLASLPAILSGVTDLLIYERLPLWLVGLAATLSLIERLPESGTQVKPNRFERWLIRRMDRRDGKPQLLLSPALRNRAAPRWDRLRGEAGFVVAKGPSAANGPWYSLPGR